METACRDLQKALLHNADPAFDCAHLLTKPRTPELQAQLFVRILSAKTNVLLLVTPDVVAALCDLITRCRDDSGDVPTSEEFMTLVASIPKLKAFASCTNYSNLEHCLRLTNAAFAAIRDRNETALRSIVADLKQPAANGAYVKGAVRPKEKRAFIFDSSAGPVQIGVPPETIKTSLKKGEQVPKVYVLLSRLFDDQGNEGEIEFPIYFAFFVQKGLLIPENRVVLIGEEAFLERIKAVFKESIYGPDHDQIYTEEEIDPVRWKAGYRVNLVEEARSIAFLKDGRPAPISDFARFQPLDSLSSARIRLPRSEEPSTEVEIRVVSSGGFMQFFEDGVWKGSVDANYYVPGFVDRPNSAASVDPSRETRMPRKPRASTDVVMPLPLFEPPTLGVTFLGTSHGFDSHGNTTGFVLWINGNGILVDPPIQASSYLRSHGIKHSLVNSVILTHCHSDHDSGLIRLIMENERITLYTTKTVHESYKRKTRASTGLSDLDDYYNFVPVPIGRHFRLFGATFEFDYSFHTIPTVRFKLSYNGKSISYSSDSIYDPEFYSRCRREGIICEERETSLRMFLFDADLIIHESGVPPVHTPIRNLNELPSSTKKKLLVVHCHGIPQTVEKVVDGQTIHHPVTDLRIPRCGLENTITLPMAPHGEGYSLASRRLKLLTDVFFFRQLSPPRLCELFLQMEECHVPATTTIIDSGEMSGDFYIIEGGQVGVYSNETGGGHLTASDPRTLTSLLSYGDSFGERALNVKKKLARTASVVALTDCRLLRVSTAVVLSIMQKHEIDVGLKRQSSIDLDVAKVTENRPFVTQVLLSTFLFKDFTADQIRLLCAMMEDEVSIPKDTVLIREGDLDGGSVWIVKEGSVRLTRAGDRKDPVEIMRLGVGSLFGEMSMLMGLPRTCTVIAAEDCRLLEIKQASFEYLFNMFPNLRFKIALQLEARTQENRNVGHAINSPHNALSPRVQGTPRGKVSRRMPR